MLDIDAFIAKYKLDDSAKEDVIELVNKCFSKYISEMSSDWLQSETPIKNIPAKKLAVKSEKLENAADAESLEQLLSTACTTTILNDYCRENGLRIGGVKKEAAARVWRHLQGEVEDDDISPRSKPKKVPVKRETHACFACNAKGQPCGLAADNQHEGEWFCFRHIDSADEIIEKKNAAVSPPVKEKVSPKPLLSKKPSAFLKKKIHESEIDENEE